VIRDEQGGDSSEIRQRGKQKSAIQGLTENGENLGGR